MTEQQERIHAAFRSHQGSEARRDDVSLFAFRYNP